MIGKYFSFLVKFMIENALLEYHQVGLDGNSSSRIIYAGVATYLNDD